MPPNNFKILVLIFILVGILDFAVGAPGPEISQRVHFMDSNEDLSNNTHIAGVSKFNSQGGGHKIMYGCANANKDDGVKLGVGVWEHSAIASKNVGVKHKVGAIGAEFDVGTNANKKVGSMARVTAVDVTLQTGQVGLNLGVNLDTGVSFSKEEVEVKILGIGTKIDLTPGKPKILEVCFIFCIGFAFGK